jgi:hypothetical protein
VISLGKHPPTEGYCRAWAGLHIDEGRLGDARLDGLNVGLILDIPGRMTEGNWSVALYVDERATQDVVDGLAAVFSGRAGGSTGLLGLLIGNVLGVKRVAISYDRDGKQRRFTIPGIISGSVEPVRGKQPGRDLVITNTEYWMGPDVTVARGVKSKVRDFGRVWDLSDRSAEILDIAWAGP